MPGPPQGQSAAFSKTRPMHAPVTLLDHVDLRVRSLPAARPLYDALLPAMGLTRVNEDGDSVGYHYPGETGAEPFFWVLEDRAHRANGTRIAFTARDRQQVDAWAAVALTAGAAAFEPPALQPEYAPHYYAAFFQDADGNNLEICCRRPGDSGP